ncbi:hypothetical protein LINPERHAP2_LOCUS3777, partial [Linum perenne]
MRCHIVSSSCPQIPQASGTIICRRWSSIRVGTTPRAILQASTFSLGGTLIPHKLVHSPDTLRHPDSAVCILLGAEG